MDLKQSNGYLQVAMGPLSQLQPVFKGHTHIGTYMMHAIPYLSKIFIWQQAESLQHWTMIAVVRGRLMSKGTMRVINPGLEGRPKQYKSQAHRRLPTAQSHLLQAHLKMNCSATRCTARRRATIVQQAECLQHSQIQACQGYNYLRLTQPTS